MERHGCHHRRDADKDAFVTEAEMAAFWKK
jgi:hypothetical protein